MSLTTILSIDDDSIVQKAIKKELQHKYEVHVARDGIKGLEAAKEILPDIILLDVEMPGMNGYEVCDTLKHDDITKDIPVIFLSSLSNLRSRMLGYEVGGVDFLVKPFSGGELIAKINSLADIINKSTSLSGEVKKANQVAFSAMRETSELGLIVQFVENSYTIKNLHKLARSFFHLCENFKLNCSLMFISQGDRSFYNSSDNTCSALEKEVISTIYDKGGRFIDFGCRTQINYTRVALLIKNMPLQDRNAYGRFKDLFPPVLGAIDAKLATLETEMHIAAQTKQLSSAFYTVKYTLLKFGVNLEQNQESVINLLRTMLADLEQQLLTMGLEEDQETSIISIIDGTITSAQKLVDTTTANKKKFATIITILDAIAARQQAIANISNEAESTLAEQKDNIDEIGDDVELF
ncbi:MAG: response regulator [Colwellia sp.]